MRKIMIWAFMLVAMLMLAGCKDKSPNKEKESSEAGKEVSNNNSSPTESPSTGTVEVVGGELVLPDSYPKDTLPLAADAKILDVRENPDNNGLEVIYVSDNEIDTLCDYYEGALKDAKDLSTLETSDGYLITATMDDVVYTISLSKDAMNSNLQYAGKISVYIILSGLAGDLVDTQLPIVEGETWPSDELPGVPELDGSIDQILREDGIIRLEITVENADKVKSFISDLTVAGFSFDTQPDLESDHMEFLAFKDNSMISFSYKGEENAVSIDYQR